MPFTTSAARLRSGLTSSSTSRSLPTPITWRSTGPQRPVRRFASAYALLFRRRLCSLTTFFWFIVFAVVLLLLLGYHLYETHIEISFYNRTWVHDTIIPVEPLAGCFAEERVSPKYNITERIWGPKPGALMSGIDMRLGLDCYEFAGTLKGSSRTNNDRTTPSSQERTLYHTYWRVDLAAFGPRQSYMLQSFFATQHLPSSHLTLWSNGPGLTRNPSVRWYLDQFPDSFDVRTVDIPSLTNGTALSAMVQNMGTVEDAKAWVDGDLIRLLLLWNFGGVWVDMDSILIRDLDPLLGHEFVIQWDCYGAMLLLLCYFIFSRCGFLPRMLTVKI